MSNTTDLDFCDMSPGVLACQAQYLLRAIDYDNPARKGLGVFLDGVCDRLYEAVDLAEEKDLPPSWEKLVDPLEASSLDLHLAIALFVSIHGNADDPAMEAVGTLLRLAKKGVDELAEAMIAKTRTAKQRLEEAAAACPEKATTEADFMAGVALAIELVRAGEKHWNTDDAEFRAENREGAPQKDVAAPFLSRLVSDPALLPGFSAVLSSVVGVGNGLHGDSFAGIGYREIIGGEADGNRAGKAAARAARSVKNKGAEVAA